MIASCCASRTERGWAKRTATANLRRTCGEETAHCQKLPYMMPVLKAHGTCQMGKMGGCFLIPGLFRRHGNLRKVSMDDQNSKCITLVEGIYGCMYHL